MTTTIEEFSINEEVKDIPVDLLQLDLENPRFGELASDKRNQTDLLDFIVQTFGVNDLLSSLSVNGYFSAEPVVCRPEGDMYIVAEGNRRLAACLILLGDERAKNQSSLTKKYQKIHEKHGSPKIDPIPAIIFDTAENKHNLLSYLGVRHIAASKSWDSYAKAVWVARIIKESGIPLEDVAAMIGDEHRALARLLEGYHFIQQLIENDRFNPADSNRKGRGSNTQYPFSWVYTLLGYKSTRRFLGIETNDAETPNPIPPEKLDNAELVTRAMFGNRSEGKNPAVGDSRQLRTLALALENQEKVQLLRQGKTLEEIERLTQPISELLGDVLVKTKVDLSEVDSRLTSEPPSTDVANQFTAMSSQIKNLATSIYNKLNAIVSGSDD